MKLDAADAADAARRNGEAVVLRDPKRGDIRDSVVPNTVTKVSAV